MATDTSGITCCFDEESERMLEDYRRRGLGSTSKTILAALRERGLAGSSTLELGCGVGALTLEFLKAGASKAKGVDLSSAMVRTARSLVQDAGHSGSAQFVHGDGALLSLERSDFVVLDTVLCCYPDVQGLIENSSAAASRFYAISIPDDRRILTRVLKVFLPLQKIFLRRRGFRFYVHPVEKVLSLLSQKGFAPVFESRAGRVWCVFVFNPPQSAP
ncbi:MAG: class I SAM-dependent methyltransferase [archaeon]|nr:MAG: class I SAM-dependent methyltransferase [archaeon]